MTNHPTNSVLHQEIDAYRRALPDLLAAGEAGRFVLIKGAQILGIWDRQAEALEEGRQRFGVDPIAVKLVDPRDVELLAMMDAAPRVACPS